MSAQLAFLPGSAPPAKGLRPRKLEFSYTGDRGGINGYSDYAQRRKEQFLRDGCAYLKDVGKRLAVHGFPHVEVHSNPAGIAVSGEMYGYFFPESGAGLGLFLCLGESAMYRPTWMLTRGDRVTLLVRWRKREIAAGKGCKAHANLRIVGEGSNQWFDPSLDSQELTEQLLNCFAEQLGIEPPAVSVPAFFEGRLWLA